MMRVVGFSAALLLLCAPVPVLAQTITDRDIPLGNATDVRLNAGGSIHVLTGGTDRSVRVRVANYGPPTPSLRIESEREGDRIDVSVSGPRESLVPIGATGFVVDVTVPRDIKLDVRAFAGTIHVDRVTAPMQLYAANGAITVDATDAPLTALADLGDIEVSNARSMIELSCGQGNVTATLADGWSANLVRLEASAGNLTLRVPPGFRAQYDATSADGAVHNSERSVAHAPLVFMLTQKGEVIISKRLKS